MRRVAGLKNVGAGERLPDHVVDLLFLSERCVVSKAASQLMELVHQTLKVGKTQEEHQSSFHNVENFITTYQILVFRILSFYGLPTLSFCAFLCGDLS